MNHPPQVEGKWKVVEYKVSNGINDIYTPEKIEYNVNLRQNGRFVDSLTDYANFYGVWKYFHNGKWELVMVSNSPDNDVFNFIPFKQKYNKVLQMNYVNYEAGTLPNTKQNAQVSYGTWTRID